MRVDFIYIATQRFQRHCLKVWYAVYLVDSNEREDTKEERNSAMTCNKVLDPEGDNWI